MSNKKLQEFKTKMETVCDLTYRLQDVESTLEDLSHNDLDIACALVERCLIIMQKARMGKRVKDGK